MKVRAEDSVWVWESFPEAVSLVIQWKERQECRQEEACSRKEKGISVSDQGVNEQMPSIKPQGMGPGHEVPTHLSWPLANICD